RRHLEPVAENQIHGAIRCRHGDDRFHHACAVIQVDIEGDAAILCQVQTGTDPRGRVDVGDRRIGDPVVIQIDTVAGGQYADRCGQVGGIAGEEQVVATAMGPDVRRLAQVVDADCLHRRAAGQGDTIEVVTFTDGDDAVVGDELVRCHRTIGVAGEQVIAFVVDRYSVQARPVVTIAGG